jgi:hypothetical protein
MTKFSNAASWYGVDLVGDTLPYSLMILSIRLSDFGLQRCKDAQAEQSGETAVLISLSQPSQFHFVARPNVGRVYSRSHDAVIRVYNEAGNVVETHEHAGQFKE